MAAPITYIVLAEKVFKKFFSDKNRKDFFIGTIFPDIRYLGAIGRGKTHSPLKHTDLENIRREQNSFWAGLKFHSLVDDVRDAYTRLNHIYSFCPDSKHRMSALKILEDELCYDRVVNWSEFVDFLNEILPEEFSFGVKKTDIKRWHKILQDYFSQKPNKTTIEKFGVDLGFTKKDLDEISKFVDEARSSDKLKQILAEFYNNLESLLT